MDLHNWMKNIDGNINIKSINIPGAHDSCARCCAFGLFSDCHSLTVTQLLNFGVRCIDLRVNGENVVHAFINCKKSTFGKPLLVYDVINEISEFLTINPSETVLLIFKNDGKISGAECLRILNEEIIEKTPQLWYTENRFPSLNESRSKIILINRINSSMGIDFSKMPYQGNSKSFCGEEFSPNEDDTVFLQDYYKLPKKKKLSQAVLPILDKNETLKGKFVLNHLSTAGFPLIPQFNSRYINKSFCKQLNKIKAFTGTVMADFISQELTEAIIKLNF